LVPPGSETSPDTSIVVGFRGVTVSLDALTWGPSVTRHARGPVRRPGLTRILGEPVAYERTPPSPPRTPTRFPLASVPPTSPRARAGPSRHPLDSSRVGIRPERAPRCTTGNHSFKYPLPFVLLRGPQSPPRVLENRGSGAAWGRSHAHESASRERREVTIADRGAARISPS